MEHTPNNHLRKHSLASFSGSERKKPYSSLSELNGTFGYSLSPYCKFKAKAGCN